MSIRLSDKLQKQLEDAAKRLDMPIREVMRLCLRIGMEHFSRIDYDTAKVIVDAVENQASKQPPAGGTGAAPPSRDPDPETTPRFGITQIIGPDPAQQASSMLNEDPPAYTLPEVGSQGWIDAKAALKKLAGQAKK